MLLEVIDLKDALTWTFLCPKCKEMFMVSKCKKEGVYNTKRVSK